MPTSLCAIQLVGPIRHSEEYHDSYLLDCPSPWSVCSGIVTWPADHSCCSARHFLHRIMWHWATTILVLTPLALSCICEPLLVLAHPCSDHGATLSIVSKVGDGGLSILYLYTSLLWELMITHPAFSTGCMSLIRQTPKSGCCCAPRVFESGAPWPQGALVVDTLTSTQVDDILFFRADLNEGPAFLKEAQLFFSFSLNSLSSPPL